MENQHINYAFEILWANWDCQIVIKMLFYLNQSQKLFCCFIIHSSYFLFVSLLFWDNKIQKIWIYVTLLHHSMTGSAAVDLHLHQPSRWLCLKNRYPTGCTPVYNFPYILPHRHVKIPHWAVGGYTVVLLVSDRIVIITLFTPFSFLLCVSTSVANVYLTWSSSPFP